ncbi:MAG: response regulator [Desulfobacter sp.]|nr:MAG: response regulator [Desulfobacter sp.]
MIDIHNMSILIVDDMKSMRSIIKKTLRHLGIGRNIHFAENGKAGLNALRERPVDLAIVDWRMPVMNGAAMLDAVRSDKLLRDMPVLMITAECERDIVYEVAEIEVDGYLIKPLTPAMLESKIRQAVEKANHPDEASLFSRKARDMDEAGKLEIAISCQKRAVSAKPKASRLKRNLGILYGKAGEVGAMEKCFLEAAASNLQDAVTRKLLSEFYWKKKEWSRSVRYACEALALTNRFNGDAVEMGRKLLVMRQNELAVALYATLIKKLEKHLSVKEDILDQCMDNGEFRFARKLLENLLEEFPSSYGLLYKAGLIFEALGEDDKALDYYLAADRHMVEPVNSKLKIAGLYCRKDKVLQADEYISQILRIDPQHKDALELRRNI